MLISVTKTYTVCGGGKRGPVTTSVVEDLDGLVPPVFDDEVGDVGGGGGSEDGGTFHFLCSSLEDTMTVFLSDPVYIDLFCLFTSRWHFETIKKIDDFEVITYKL